MCERQWAKTHTLYREDKEGQMESEEGVPTSDRTPQRFIRAEGESYNIVPGWFKALWESGPQSE